MTLLERVHIEETETFWMPERMPIGRRDPVEIRLSIDAQGAAGSSPAAHYAVVTGLFRMLRDLSVVDVQQEVSEDGLVFYLTVRESRSVVRSYLQNTKRYHVLGKAWDFVLVDGAHVSTVIGEVRRAPLDLEELQSLVYAHTQMGSRPLRFSRYFLYAALLPYGRVRGYGSGLMHREDSKGESRFRRVLEEMELLQRSFATLDFSGISSREELLAFARPVLQALTGKDAGGGHPEGFFLASLFLAVLYEQKTPPEEYGWRMQTLSHGLDREKDRLVVSDGILQMISTGFAPLTALLDERRDALLDLDDLSLRLFSTLEDSTTRADMPLLPFQQVRHLAQLAWEDRGVRREQLDHFFQINHLVTNDVRDEISLLQLLDFLQEEE